MSLEKNMVEKILFLSFLMTLLTEGSSLAIEKADCGMRKLARYYSEIFRYPDTEFIQKWVKTTGGPIVDLGSATGRVLEMGLTHGISAIGIDSSPHMILVGKERLIRFGDQVQWIEGDFTRTAYPSDVGLITCVGNTYSMILERRSRVNMLNVARQHLRPKGRALIWIKNSVGDAQSFVHKTLTSPEAGGGDLDYHLSWTEDRKNWLRIYEMSLKDKSGEESHRFETVMLSSVEMRAEIIEAGFEIEAFYGDFPEIPFTEESPWQIYVLRVPSPN